MLRNVSNDKFIIDNDGRKLKYRWRNPTNYKGKQTVKLARTTLR